MNNIQILNAIMEYKKIRTKADFARILGISNQNLSKWYSRDTINIDVIREAIPELSTDWLLTGEGNMLREQPTEREVEGLTVPISQCVTYHPDIPVTATASDVPDLSYEDRRNKVLMYIPGLEGCDAFTASGESMLPTITPGHIVAGKEWTERYVQNGEMYVIITRTGNRMVKRLTHDSTDDDNVMHFTCYSDNPDQVRYRPFHLSGEDIHRLFIVKAIIPILL